MRDACVWGTWVRGLKKTPRREMTDIDLSQERIRHLHAVCAACPRAGDACVALCGVDLFVIRWHVGRVEHEKVDCVRETAREWMGE